MGLVDSLSFVVSKGCHQALTVYHCRLIFPPCGTVLPNVLPAPEVCTHVTTSCSALELATVNATYIRFGRGLPGAALGFPALGFTAYCHPLSTVANVTYAASARAPLCEPYTGSVCNGIINYDVYIPQQFATSINSQLVTSQTVVERILANANFLFNLLPSTCRDKYVKLACATAFSKCNTAIPNLPIKVPSFPDRTLCEDVANACPFSLLNNSFGNALQIVNCTSTFDPNAGSYIRSTSSCTGVEAAVVARFPVGSVTINNIPISTSTAVSNISSEAIFAALPPCPAPTVKTTDPDVAVNNGACAPPCPSLLYTQEQYDQSDNLMLGLSLTSTVLITLLSVTNILFKRTRRKRYAIYFTVAIFFVSWMLLFGGVAQNTTEVPGRYAKMRCQDSSHPSKRGYCLWLAMVMLYAGFSAVAWWFVQATDLYLNISWAAAKWSAERTRRKDIIYHVWGFGYPLCVLAISLGLDVLGDGNQGIPYCLFIDSPAGDGVGWGLFYGPIFGQCVVGFVLMAFIIRQLWMSSIQLQAHKKKGWWKMYIKPLIFVGIFEFVWLFVFSYRIYGQVQKDEFKTESANLLRCVLQDRPAAAALGQTITCPSGASPDLGLWYMIQIVIAGVGLWSFLLYNTEENFVLWYHFIFCKPYNFSKTDTSTTGSATRDTASPRASSRKVLRTKKPTKTDTPGNSATEQIENLPLDKPLPTNIALSYDKQSSTDQMNVNATESSSQLAMNSTV